MIRPMRWLWPSGVAGRIAVILIGALLVIHTVAFALFARDRWVETTRVFAQSVVTRMTAIVDLVEAAPAEDRADLLQAVNSPTLWVTWTAEPPMPSDHDVPFEETVREYLQPLSDRPIRIDIPEHWQDWHDRDGPELGPPPDLQPSRRKLLISVGQPEGGWLVFTVSSPYTAGSWLSRTVVWSLLTIGIVALISVWAARRVTAPISRFAAAADRLGVDVEAPPLPETGPKELRQATHAFNRMQDRLRRLIADRTLMLAAISHDLRTALTRLRLRADYIDDPEQQAKALSDLDEMTTMLDSTLSFARDDAASEERTKVDIATLLQSLCDDLADAGQPVTYEGPDRMTLLCRPVALRRAFANLIDNAVTYGGEATVSLAAVAGEVVVSFADRGPGIPAGRRERVFAPFYRLEESRSRETGGTGLGLAVVRSIVRRHGGDIALEDRPGGGLIVRVMLPEPRD